MRWFKPALLIVTCIAALLWLAWKGLTYHHHLRFVPEEMNVRSIVYVAEESWGFGPGGNETGIIVFEMPTQVRRQLFGRDGLLWLNALPSPSWRGWYARFGGWHTTPPPENPLWYKPEVCPPGSMDKAQCRGIAAFMGRWGFPVPIDHEIEAMVNEALFTPGAYYAFGRTGVLILIPKQARVVFAYSG